MAEKQVPPEEQKNVVVVLEDDASMSQAILLLLRASDFCEIAFPSAETLLKAMEVTTAGCLALDIGLPGVSGFELYQRLLEAGAKLPVIFITVDDRPSGQNGRESSEL